MDKMKKHILILTAVFMVFAAILTGCGNDETSDTSATEITTEYNESSDLEEETETGDESTDEENPDAELEKSLVGLWTNGDKYIEFTENNFFVAMDDDRHEYTGTYSLVSNGKTMALALAENEDDIKTYTVEFKNDMKKLIITDDKGNKTEFEYNEVKE